MPFEKLILNLSDKTSHFLFFQTMCEAGEIVHDKNQEIVTKYLDEYVNDTVYANRLQLKRYKYELSQLSNEEKNMNSRAWHKVNQNYKMIHDLKSIYIWGDPGCGKSFILETMFKNLKIDQSQIKFMHYQEFMLKVHQQEHKINKKLKG